MTRSSIVIALAGLAGALALLCAADPPQIPQPHPAERNFSIKGNGLTIQPGEDSTYLRFDGGVVISGQGLSVSAESAELVLEGTGMAGGDLKLPKMDVPRDRISQDPGQVAADMAKSLKLPRPEFSRNALRHIGATGKVEFSGNGLTLSTPGLVSADGGRSWSTQGRSSIRRSTKASGKKKAEAYALDADNLLYDIETQQAAAHGNVQGSFERSGEDKVTVNAQQAELNLKTSELSVSEELSASVGALTLSCGRLSANLEDGRLSASGMARLSESELGIRMQAEGLVVNTKTRELLASGKVTLEDSQRGVTISAGRLEGTLGVSIESASELPSGQLPEGSRLVASENPVVRYKDSTFTGEKITVTQEAGSGRNGKTVVEVEGPQKAQVDVKDLEEK